MRRWSRLAACLIIASGTVFSGAAFAQDRMTAGADALFYGDNTEFRNPFREGETLFGAAIRLDAEVRVGDNVTLALGAFGNQRFGSEDGFDLVRPVAALIVKSGRSSFVLGTLTTPRLGRPAGPDRAGPHGLIPAIQRETLAFERPYEAGMQWTFKGARLEHESWLQWQRLNTPEHRERLDAGARLDWRAHGPLVIPLQAHIVHEGGQLHASGVVRDSVAVASGVVLTTRRRSLDSVNDAIVTADATLELLGLWSHDTPDREQAARTVDGGAFFGRGSIELNDWRAHLIMWRGDDYMKDEGDPNYLARRRDGTRWRGIRDYAEAGLTRTFVLSPSALVEASFRMHRVERHYEYSYRIVARVTARTKPR